MENFRQRFLQEKISRELFILKKDMSESMVSSVKEIVFKAIKEYESLPTLIQEINNKMITKHSGNWQCFVYSNFGSSCTRHAFGKYIAFDLAELRFIIYEASN